MVTLGISIPQRRCKLVLSSPQLLEPALGCDVMAKQLYDEEVERAEEDTEGWQCRRQRSVTYVLFSHCGAFITGERTCCGQHQLKAAGLEASRQLFPSGVSAIRKPSRAARTAGKDTRGRASVRCERAGKPEAHEHERNCIGVRPSGYVLL